MNIKNFCLFLSLVVSTFLSAQDASDLNKTKYITGDWKIVKMVTADTKAMDTLDAETRAEMDSSLQAVYESSKMVFRPNSDFVMELMGNVENGTWKVTNSGRILEISSGGKTDLIEIKKAEENDLILFSIEGSQELKLFLIRLRN